MEHVSKKPKINNDENTGRILKAKTTLMSFSKRTALSDIINQTEAVSAPRGKQGAAVAKAAKPKAKTAAPTKTTKVPTGIKGSSRHEDGAGEVEEGLEEIDSILEQAGGCDVDMEMEAAKADRAEEESYAAKLERLGVMNIDLEDADDPLAVTEYVVPIFDYLRELERKHQPSPVYMTKQTDITWKMRTTLVNWLVEVHWKYKLYPETLFLAVNVMDRYLAQKAVSRDNLQLIGVTAMLIASKFEEIYSPSTEDFLYVCNDSYTQEQLLKMEREMLCALSFELGNPCPLTFLRRISKAEQYDIPSRTVAKYLIEVSILDERFLHFHPSLLAAGATWLARKMLKKGSWDKTLEFYSGYSEGELEECVNELLSFLQQNATSKSRSIYKKYSSSKFLRASLFVEQKISAWMNNEEGPSPPEDLTN